MASTRADQVAELLWELKRAAKLAKYSTIARRAGFSAGANGKAMETCLRTVRRDWPHLQWWRAVSDSGLMAKGSEQAQKLEEAGIALKSANDKTVALATPDELLMIWETAGEIADVETAAVK